MIRSDKFPIGGGRYAYDRLRHSCSFLSLRESICLASILAAVERRRRAMFVEWSHSKWHKPRRRGTFPLPIERHAAPPELRPFSLYVIYKHDAPLALNLATLPSIVRLGIANAVGAKQPRPDAKHVPGRGV